MANEILTVAQCYEADRYAAAQGVSTLTLMENAGRAVADEICKRWSPRPVAVLCGPGNNGGDGYVAARLLKERGWNVWVETLVDPSLLKGDAAEMAKRWSGRTIARSHLNDPAELYVDAMFGAGLSRPLESEAMLFADDSEQTPERIVAIDVPSGVNGDMENLQGDAWVNAALTVTFFRKKPAHVLAPGCYFCGEVVVADIGIPEAANEIIKPKTFENGPALWGRDYPMAEPGRPQICARALCGCQRASVRDRRGEACGSRGSADRCGSRERGESAGRGSD